MYFNNKKIVLLSLSIFLIGSVKAQQPAQIQMSLNQIWEKVAANNKTIQMQDLKVKGTVEGIKDAKAERLPEISAEGEYAKVSNMPIYTNGLFHTPEQFEVVHTSYKFGGSAYFNLYNGNKTNIKIAEEKKENEIAVEQRNLTTSEMKLRATAYFLDLQRSNIFKALLLKDISDQEKQLEEIKQLLKNGVVLKSDVLRVTLKLSRQKMALVQLNNDLAIANQKLNILTGLPDQTVIEPVVQAKDELPVLQPYTTYLSEAMQHSFAYKISEKEGELRKLELKNVKANVSFKVGLFANYAYSYPQIFIYPYSVALYGLGMTGIKASFPISAFYHNTHKARAAELRYQQQEVEHSDTEDRIRQEVNEAYLRYQESLTRIDVAKENINQATENLRIVNNTYFNQLALVTDLLDADTQLLQTRFDLAAAKIAAQLQYYQLQKAIGNL
ncbi:TolC family protein [Pedobacter cryoconitis]|uniref:Outer membrane protein TolC n=1 Tax=Pedobacter cryoconitis TaxID=188932 RepID=A0A7X0J6L4_9SPHI|nr:TolC family protein [Pedobacter cryoconitis]MBB6502060.1 outer membrane protein TolC [Pedobacter cryoconitis]